MKKLALLLILFFGLPVFAEVLVQQNFDSLVPGARMFDQIGPSWTATTFAFKVGNTPGLAASGNQYLAAPSRVGTGANPRWGWYDASTAFNFRTAGNNTVIGTVKMYIPEVTEHTYGGMFMYDQAGDVIGVMGVDMANHMTLTNASNGVNDIAVNLGQYNDIEMIASFNSGLVDYFFNGIEIGSSLMSASSLAAGFGDFDFYNNGENAATSVAFRYDDYMVQAVPEPGTETLVIGALGLLGMISRRRKGLPTA